MGVVYEAADPAIGRRVAIKLLNLQVLTGPGEAQALRERLFREARSAGALSHPGIVIVYDVGEDQETAFIAMEFVDGPTLQHLQQKGGMLPAAQVVDIVKQVASALDYAHKNGIVHRDIKPANIMLHQGEQVKIADFGIAKITTAPKYTVTGLVMGTPAYMSPEQIEGREVDGRSDQFALAVVAYELLTGGVPFEGNTYASMVHSIVYGERPSARARNPVLPPGFDEALARGMATRPENRFPSCMAFAAALESALEAAERTAALRNEETVVIAPKARPGSVPSAPPPAVTPVAGLATPAAPPPQPERPQASAQGPIHLSPQAPMPTLHQAPVQPARPPIQSTPQFTPPPPPISKSPGAGGLLLGLVGLGIAALSLGALAIYKFHPFGILSDNQTQQQVQQQAQPKTQQTAQQIPSAPTGDQGAVKPPDSVPETKPPATEATAPKEASASQKPSEETAKQKSTAEKKTSDLTAARKASKTLPVIPPEPAPPPVPARPLTAPVTVQSNRAWTDTGIDLIKSDLATIEASGRIHVHANSKVAQQQPGGFFPNCATAVKLFNFAMGSVPAPELSCWSLIGRIGLNGAIFPIGMNGTVPLGSGRLYLGVNDDDYSDNTGTWSATVRVERR
jgi:serine/threonine protein kinase